MSVIADFAGQAPVAVVTGASAGIGRGTVDRLAAEGYRVAAVSRGVEEVDDWAGSGNVRPYACDVSDREAVTKTMRRIDEELGRIDGLVNCAGNLAEGPLETMPEEQIRMQLEVNLVGTLYTCQAAIPYLRRTRGSIVNFSSLLTRRTWPGTSVYTATKGGIEAFSRALAHELGPDGIRVNVISPSLIRSSIYLTAGMSPQDYEEMLVDWQARFPLGRVGEPEDATHLVSFLLSPQSGWITGTNIPVDGGRGVA